MPACQWGAAAARQTRGKGAHWRREGGCAKGAPRVGWGRRMEKESPRGAGNWLKGGGKFWKPGCERRSRGREVGRGRWRRLTEEEEEVAASQSVPPSQEYRVVVPSPTALGILFLYPTKELKGGFRPLPPLPIAILLDPRRATAIKTKKTDRIDCQ